MNKESFQEVHFNQFKAIMESQCGKDLIELLRDMRPPLIPLDSEHRMIENAGAVRGYEQCIKNLLSLVVPVPIKKPDIVPTYQAIEKPLPDYLKDKSEKK